VTLDEEAIFLEALEKTSAEERSKYLQGACAGDPVRRREIERLLEAHARADRFLAGRPALPGTCSTVLERPGTQIGPYKLLEQIGEGGFGAVFVAEQLEPVRRQVALKILKPGMDTLQVVARFEAERQALAMMDHPNIAKVLDAGATGSGRPYFAMELVKGVPITSFCDERRLTPRERLQLYVPVKLGADHPDTLNAQQKLALLYQGQGNLGLAETLLKEILAIRTVKLGADDRDTLRSRYVLATLYQLQGKLVLAEPLYREVLAKHTEKLGPDHPDTVAAKCRLATLYQEQGNSARAEAIYQEVVAVLSSRLGADHVETLRARHSLAELYRAEGRDALAEALHQDLLALRSAKLGTDHLDTTLSRDCLAMLYSSMKKPGQAIALLEESLELKKTQLGPDHREVLGRQVTLGSNYCDAGRFAEGIALIEKVRRNGRSDPHPAWVRSALLSAYVRAGKSAEAVTLVEERVREAREQFSPESPELAAALIDNGKALLDAKAYAGAEPLLLSGYQGLTQSPAQNVPPQVEGVRIEDALDRLVRLYDAWGKPDEAAKWRKELAAARAAGPPREPKGS
jgi:tetratricopeptide (TPR) repeat protein